MWQTIVRATYGTRDGRRFVVVVGWTVFRIEADRLRYLTAPHCMSQVSAADKDAVGFGMRSDFATCSRPVDESP
jgi:hypothetical protein